ncbi:PD-(D/E)XK motif protein [Dyadobacter diqingensis]|uniref:PD-(D/E)XK motif protein n=1 Tax=Dyadobacter diqingensis TaxID=2938121 RepID=UPI0020C1A227|nr:PD-(D/E)XK motif protein [Dyadobacter diqingensis]
MMTIKEIWVQQENDLEFTSGIMLRGFTSGILPRIFVALKSPGKNRCLAASVSNSHIIDLKPYNGLMDLEVTLDNHPRESDRNLLLFKLINPAHNDIFAILCEDLINSARSITDERILIHVMLNRFANWNGLFKKAAGDWLSAESQQGLWGELHCLKLFLEFAQPEHFSRISTWVGCEGQVRDFQSGMCAVEVKTTRGNNHQQIIINGDRQLDPTHLDSLYLFHISLEVLQNAGQTLPALIEEIRYILDSDAAALNRFNAKLLFVGYHSEDEVYYVDTGYLMRVAEFYKIEGDFPRIQENELRQGVGDVKYSVTVSSCQNYLTDSFSVFTNLNYHD